MFVKPFMDPRVAFHGRLGGRLRPPPCVSAPCCPPATAAAIGQCTATASSAVGGRRSCVSSPLPSPSPSSSRCPPFAPTPIATAAVEVPPAGRRRICLPQVRIYRVLMLAGERRCRLHPWPPRRRRRGASPGWPSPDPSSPGPDPGCRCRWVPSRRVQRHPVPAFATGGPRSMPVPCCRPRAVVLGRGRLAGQAPPMSHGLGAGEAAALLRHWSLWCVSSPLVWWSSCWRRSFAPAFREMLCSHGCVAAWFVGEVVCSP
ncbi:hypothetical protein BS78_K289200 [Paspalum vaginatum]|uniref:Uncharacterized protein n=1 Tax=Paspalum vaginatum TaxID=158149 RepID=A0A9W7XAQ0_9POAL|nr:hypothetical protein BS78_K289200 [Paspalum vaginatum]